VRIGDEKLNARFFQKPVIARIEGTLGQPDATRIASEMFAIIVFRNLDLGAFGFVIAHQRQKAVRRTTSDDFQEARVLQFFEAANDVAVIFVLKHLAAFVEMPLIHAGCRVKILRFSLRALDFFISQFTKLVEMLDIPFLQERIAQHFAQWRRHGHRQAKRHAFVAERLKRLEERNIRFADGFVQPVFFQKVRVFRMSHKR
jgi:hypothetical protein